MSKNIILTLNNGIVLPTLSRRTGNPCRATETRWLIVQIIDSGVRLVGCLDRNGRVFRTAVRDNVRLQERTLVNARELKPDDDIMCALNATTKPGFDMGAASKSSDYRSVRLTDAMNSISAWPSENGDITACMSTVCGMLVPACDPLTPPFRHVGVLWRNGDFARNSSSGVISFAGSAGVVFAAAYPDELATRFMQRNDAMWADWLPEAPGESMKRSAARMAEAFPKRGHALLTPALIAKYMGKRPESEALSLKRGMPLKPVFWKNGMTRSGKPFNTSDPALATLFAPLLDPVTAE
ncbi:MAG: hypothetical protein Q8O35_01240 [Humidesulfovibrio sp.]|uniref:hypothetical protein n=1 Tax=Humidesulfovibrio sp. TaxID=2910988 RepID=UPI00273632AA|nr:hypothetical protein [Humidesulfovibrio sp.]MDP2846796.1 hypothetical protein [Humidesulfovibrio sp.]